MPKQRSFSQFDGGAGSAAARRGKEGQKSPKSPSRGSKSRSAPRHKSADEVRGDMKRHRRDVLRGGY